MCVAPGEFRSINANKVSHREQEWKGVQFSQETTYLSLTSSYKWEHLNSSKFYYFVV